MTIDELKELMETGEKFEIDRSPYTFAFRDNEILVYDNDNGWRWSNVKMNDLFGATIIRKPWKPKVGETYYMWITSNDERMMANTSSRFCGFVIDLQAIAFGNCFRTREECEKHTEIRDKLIEMRKEYV